MSRRNYPYSDSSLLEWGDTTTEHLKTDIKSFSAFDKKLNQDFLTNLEKQVTDGFAEGGDNINLAQLRQKTEVVEEAMQTCQKYFKRLKYWVLDAFPGKKAIQKQFGISGFTKIKDNQTKMIQYMEGLKDTIKRYRIELEKAGASSGFLDQSQELAETLRGANKEQEQKKGTRTVDTADRVERLNDLYAILRKINAAADNVFEDQAAKRELYRPPSRNTSGNDTIEE
ncbi:hypothetical protein [Aquimarina algiphila]|uniref:hypothetical protein n=1 Tax=Aquimarina algiphila TaxID=2047982 RepID=UPI002330B67E|nr:hypothetical protein [Aquimarina algiphila]